MIPSHIKNIIFDLGGVIITLDEPRAHAALAQLAAISTPEMQDRIRHNNKLFHSFERGHISNSDFLQGLRELVRKDYSDEELTEAWNAMLIRLLPGNVDALSSLAKDYRLFMFSNTNDIHIAKVHKMVKGVSGLPDFSSIFEKVYYSQEAGERKPDAAAWQLILDNHQLNPAETLFIDDNEANIKAAAELGIQTWHYPLNKPLQEALDGRGK